MGIVAKVFGSLLIVVGVLLLLGGIAAAVYSYTDEQHNQDQLLHDANRGNQNADVEMYGLVGAGVGLIALIVGVVLIAIGPTAGLAAPAAGVGQPPRVRLVSGGRAIAVFAAVAGSVLLVLVVVVALGGERGAAASSLGFFRSSSQGPLGGELFEGSVSQGVSAPLLGSLSNGNNDHDLQSPAGASRLSAIVNWTPQNGGAGKLELIVTSPDGSELARQVGAAGFVVEIRGPHLDGAQLHYQVFPADFAGAVVEQGFTITTQFWAM